jgi:hypothetical protein
MHRIYVLFILLVVGFSPLNAMCQEETCISECSCSVKLNGGMVVTSQITKECPRSLTQDTKGASPTNAKNTPGFFIDESQQLSAGERCELITSKGKLVGQLSNCTHRNYRYANIKG